MKRLSATLLLFFAFCGFSRATSSESSTQERNNLPKSELSMDQKEDIRRALTALKGRKFLDSFVIIKETTSGKAVQFAVTDGKLLFDLPTKRLSEDQIKEAETVLEPYGILLEVQKMYHPNDASKVIGETRGFSKEIGTDVDLAIEIVEALITTVFNPDGIIDISLVEN